MRWYALWFVIVRLATIQTKSDYLHELIQIFFLQFSDLPDDTKPDIIDIATGAVERYMTDLPVGVAYCAKIE